MIKRVPLVFLMSAVCFMVTALPSYGYEVGLSLDGWQATVADDPGGDVETAFQSSYLNLFGRYSFGYFHRVKVSVSDIDVAFDASTNEIGQEGSGTQIQGVYQRRFDIADQSMFGGIGLAYRDMEYNSRQTVTDSGSLQDQFFDVERDEVSLVFSLEKVWPVEFLSNEMGVGFEMSYYQPFDEGLQGIKFGIGLSYDFAD